MSQSEKLAKGSVNPVFQAGRVQYEQLALIKTHNKRNPRLSDMVNPSPTLQTIPTDT